MTAIARPGRRSSAKCPCISRFRSPMARSVLSITRSAASARSSSSSLSCADAVGDRPVEGQRVAPARLGVAALQHLVGAGEEDQADAMSRFRLQALDALQQRRGAEAAGAAVDAERHGPVEARRGVEQGQRQIVHRLIAQILQRAQRRAMAGARQARHQDDGERRAALLDSAQGFRRRGGLGRRRGCRCLAHGARIIAPAPTLASSRNFAAAEAWNGSRTNTGRAMPR